MTRPVLALALASAPALAQTGEGIAPFFGFGEPRIIVVDEGCGPAITGDVNADGLPDVIVANNRKSRIEVYELRAEPRTDAELERDAKPNELAPSRWYDRRYVSVRYRVGALRALDANGDGWLDLLFAAADPQELVLLVQDEDGLFEIGSRRRVKGLGASPVGLEIGDVVGDDRPEAIGTIEGEVYVFPITEDGLIGAPEPVGGNDVFALFVEDFNGDGMEDVLGVSPDDPAPLRLWLQREDGAGAGGVLPAELRFEMPPLTEAEPIRFPDRAAASIAVIERQSQRMLFYDLSTEEALVASEGGVERDVQAEVRPFVDGSNKDRSLAVTDANGDGMPDLVATDDEHNAIALYLQQEGLGLGPAVQFPTFKQPDAIAVGRWGEIDQTLFVMSGEEKTVGIAPIDRGHIGFPEPLSLATPGAEPVAMAYVEIDGTPTLAVVVKKRREHTLELHQPLEGGSSVTTVELKDVSRPPRTVLAADADRDDHTDLMLLTPNEPMILVRGAEGALPTQVLQKDDMPQFGLVQAAGPDNTVLADIDDDGVPELVIADANFVRACVYDTKLGWRVVEQVNVPDAGTKLAGLTVLDAGRLVASDSGGGRLLVIGRDTIGDLAVLDRIHLLGFSVGAIRAGAFGGDGQPGVLCLGDESFALVRLGGQRAALHQFAVWRSDDEDRVEHEIEVGDINADGYVDLVVLDAGEQMCEFFTFSAKRRLFFATEFKVFESRLFHRGNDREYEPSAAVVADLTGDGYDDVMLTVHDRLIIYPQETE